MINLNSEYLEMSLLGGITILVLAELKEEIPEGKLVDMNREYFENFDNWFSDWKAVAKVDPTHPMEYLYEFSTFVATRLLASMNLGKRENQPLRYH